MGNGNIAQLVEHSTENAGVVGSIPTVATKNASSEMLEAFLFFWGTVWGTIIAAQFSLSHFRSTRK